MLPIQTKGLTDQQFKQCRSLIYEECGIHLTEEKRELLNARIGKRLRCLNLQPDAYVKLVMNDPDERVQFVDAVSTNHTYFFREPGPFRFMNTDCRRIWCAAASSGEEPYSLASHCYVRNIDVAIWATDISTRCLYKGRTGVYPIRDIRNIPDDILRMCFQKGRNTWSGYFRVKPCIRQMVNFSQFNLLSDHPPERRFDVVFCRNVMIYFDRVTKEKVVHMLIRALKPSGYLIIGGAESLNGLQHPLRYIEPSVYQRR